MSQPSAADLIKNIVESGLWSVSPVKPPEDEAPANTDHTDELTPVDDTIPPPTLPRTSTEQGMMLRRD